MKPRVRLREERIVQADLEVRAAADGQPLRIIGHPVVYNRWSEDLGGFRERVIHGAATKTIGESDIRVLFNHDVNFILGRNKAGTVDFADTASGMKMDCRPPETDTIRDLVIVPMQRGDLTQMSFAFRTVRDEWREPPQTLVKDGLWERDVLEFQMYDASIVTFPAYTQTDAAVRDAMGWIDGLAGLDLRTLTATITRLERGIQPTNADLDLLNGSISALRTYLPDAPAASADHAPEPQAGPGGPPVAHLLRLLEHKAREAAPSI